MHKPRGTKQLKEDNFRSHKEYCHNFRSFTLNNKSSTSCILSSVYIKYYVADNDFHKIKPIDAPNVYV